MKNIKCEYCSFVYFTFTPERKDIHHKTCSGFEISCQYCGQKSKRMYIIHHEKRCNLKPKICETCGQIIKEK